MSGPVFEGSLSCIGSPEGCPEECQRSRGTLSKLLVEVKAGTEPSMGSRQAELLEEPAIWVTFLEEKVRLGKMSQPPARPPDQDTVSTSCLFWESEILY